MPVYEFKCSACNNTFDSFKKISSRDEPLSEPCPKCGVSGKVETVINAPSVSYSTAKMPVNVKLKEKFQQIHENTPGSRLNTTSSITPI